MVSWSPGRRGGVAGSPRPHAPCSSTVGNTIGGRGAVDSVGDAGEEAEKFARSQRLLARRWWLMPCCTQSSPISLPSSLPSVRPTGSKNVRALGDGEGSARPSVAEDDHASAAPERNEGDTLSDGGYSPHPAELKLVSTPESNRPTMDLRTLNAEVPLGPSRTVLCMSFVIPLSKRSESEDIDRLMSLTMVLRRLLKRIAPLDVTGGVLKSAKFSSSSWTSRSMSPESRQSYTLRMLSASH